LASHESRGAGEKRVSGGRNDSFDAATGGVDSDSHAVETTDYKENHRKAFSVAIVQSTGQAGDIVVTAEASGLAIGSAPISAQ
jgi:hypothetical protein